MRPILVLQHIDNGGPALFAQHVHTRGLSLHLLRPDLGDAVPGSGAVDRYSGICFCGGTQSVNDAHGWIEDELALIQAAHDAAVPVIGHCLGGQLISKAMGGTVQRHVHEEFGWHRLLPARHALARDWLGDLDEPLVAIQWHEDTFSIPPGGRQILSGEHCPAQAFVIGNMLAMQFHVEVDAAMVRYWTVDLAHLAPAPGPAVQSPRRVLDEAGKFLPRSMALARRLYDKWLNGCPGS